MLYLANVNCEQRMALQPSGPQPPAAKLPLNIMRGFSASVHSGGLQRGPDQNVPIRP